jgi:hypothetical protein
MNKYCLNFGAIIAQFDTYYWTWQGMLTYEIATVSIQTEEIILWKTRLQTTVLPAPLPSAAIT